MSRIDVRQKVLAANSEVAEALRPQPLQAGAQRRAGIVGDHADGERRRLVIALRLRHATASLPVPGCP